MIEADRREFFTLMHRLGAAFRTRVPDATLEIYWQTLEEFSLRIVRRGIEGSIRNEKRFPVPAVIRARIFDMRQSEPASRHLAITGPVPTSDPEHARLAFRLIADIQAKGLSVAQQLDSFRWMERHYPTFGWDEAMRDAEQRLSARGQQ